MKLLLVLLPLLPLIKASEPDLKAKLSASKKLQQPRSIEYGIRDIRPSSVSDDAVDIPSMLRSQDISELVKDNKLFLKYLAWKYDIPEISEISEIPAIDDTEFNSYFHHFEGIDHLKCAFEAISSNGTAQMLQDLVFASPLPPVGPVLSLLHGLFLTNKVHGFDSDHVLGIIYTRCMDEGLRERFLGSPYGYLEELPAIISEWFRRDGVKLNRQLFILGAAWNESLAKAYLNAEGTHLDDSIELKDLMSFFRSLIYAKSFDGSLIRRKVFPYLNSLITDHSNHFLVLRMRHDPEFKVRIRELLRKGPDFCFLAGRMFLFFGEYKKAIPFCTELKTKGYFSWEDFDETIFTGNLEFMEVYNQKNGGCVIA